MMVMIMASTPSLNASRRPLPMDTSELFWKACLF
jgi:hypothetical protein